MAVAEEIVRESIREKARHLLRQYAHDRKKREQLLISYIKEDPEACETAYRIYAQQLFSSCSGDERRAVLRTVNNPNFAESAGQVVHENQCRIAGEEQSGRQTSEDHISSAAQDDSIGRGNSDSQQTTADWTAPEHLGKGMHARAHNDATVFRFELYRNVPLYEATIQDVSADLNFRTVRSQKDMAKIRLDEWLRDELRKHPDGTKVPDVIDPVILRRKMKVFGLMP